MPASTGRREQPVCFFAGGREPRIRMPGESCRRWTRGREADWQRRGAHLELACGFAVAGRWSGALAAERRSAEQAHATRRADGDPLPIGVHAAREGGCAAQGVGHVQLRGPCVWAWRGGVARLKNAARVPLRPWKPPRTPRPRARGNPLCVCVRHTARHTLWGVQLVWQGLGAGCGREGSPHALRRGRRWATACAAPCACVRRAGGVSAPRDASSQRNRKFADGGHYQRTEKSRNWSSRAEPDEAGGMRLDRGPSPSRSASAARRARAWSKKKGGRPKGTDSRGGAPDARRKPTLPTLFKTTRRCRPAKDCSSGRESA